MVTEWNSIMGEIFVHFYISNLAFKWVFSQATNKGKNLRIDCHICQNGISITDLFKLFIIRIKFIMRIEHQFFYIF